MKESGFLKWYNFKNYNTFLKTYNFTSSYKTLMLFKKYYKDVYIPFLLEKDHIYMFNKKSKNIL